MDKIETPCAYQGGKQRISKDIVDILFKKNVVTDDTKFYDLCCGSGAISVELVNRGISPFNITMVDKSPWGLFWQKIGEGTFSTDVFGYYLEEIPDDVSKIQDHVLRLSKLPANDGLFNNAVYKFLILQAAAFGSKSIWVKDNKWMNCSFRRYWLPTTTSKRRSPVNPMMPMPHTLFKRVELLSHYMEGVTGYYGDIFDIGIDDGAIVYIDPPYKETTTYGFECDYMKFISNITNKVYLSEGAPMSPNAIKISGARGKGGISGERKTKNEEWLSVFN